MGTSAQFLLTMGGILLLGLFISALAQRTFLPRVTLLLIFGMIIGNEFLNLIPDIFSERFDMIADMTLLMVGFLLGGKLTLPSLKDQAGEVFWISLTAAIITTVIVSLGLYLIGVSLEISTLLGCIASATAPAAILDVTEESGINNRFSNLLVSVVALDDIWALVLFAIGLAVVGTLNGTLIETSFIMILSKEIGGAVLLGALIGVPAAYLTGRIKPGQPILTEALGIVFVCGGLALWLDVSYLIASIIMGAVIANLAKHHDYPFHAIEGIEKPLMVIFFTLAGASLEISVLKEIGLMGIAYIFCRILGKYIGARIGCQISRTTGLTRRWIGVALLPQAGVSIGMALVASSHFPEYRQLLLSLVVGSTVFFEIIGPVFTNMALQRTYKQ